MQCREQRVIDRVVIATAGVVGLTEMASMKSSESPLRACAGRNDQTLVVLLAATREAVDHATEVAHSVGAETTLMRSWSPDADQGNVVRVLEDPAVASGLAVDPKPAMTVIECLPFEDFAEPKNVLSAVGNVIASWFRRSDASSIPREHEEVAAKSDFTMFGPEIHFHLATMGGTRAVAGVVEDAACLMLSARSQPEVTLRKILSFRRPDGEFDHVSFELGGGRLPAWAVEQARKGEWFTDAFRGQTVNGRLQREMELDTPARVVAFLAGLEAGVGSNAERAKRQADIDRRVELIFRFLREGAGEDLLDRDRGLLKALSDALDAAETGAGVGTAGSTVIAQFLSALRRQSELEEQHVGELFSRDAVAALTVRAELGTMIDQKGGEKRAAKNALVAMELWCEQLQSRGSGIPRAYDDAAADTKKVSHALQLVTADARSAGEKTGQPSRNAAVLRELFVRHALVGQFNILGAASLLWKDAGRATKWGILAPLASLLLAGVAAVPVLDAVGGDYVLGRIVGVALLGVTLALVSALTLPMGYVATMPMCLRLLSASAVGGLLLIGIQSQIKQPITTIGHSLDGYGGLLAFGASATLAGLYLLVERRAHVPVQQGSRWAAAGAAGSVALVGVTYAAMLALIVTPVVLEASDVAHLEWGPVLVIAAIVLLTGIVSQLFWNDKTAVDPL